MYSPVDPDFVLAGYSNRLFILTLRSLPCLPLGRLGHKSADSLYYQGGGRFYHKPLYLYRYR